MLKKTLTKLPVSVSGDFSRIYLPMVYAHGNYIYSAAKEGDRCVYDGTKWNTSYDGNNLPGFVDYYTFPTIFEYNGKPMYMVPSNNTDPYEMVFKSIEVSDTGTITFSDDPVATITISSDDPDYAYYQTVKATSWNGEIYVNKHSKLYKISNGELEVVASLPFKVDDITKDNGQTIVSKGDTYTVMMLVYNNELCMMSPEVGMWTFNGKRWKKLCNVPFVNIRGGVYNNPYAFYRDKLYVADVAAYDEVFKLYEFDGLTWKEITGIRTTNAIVPVVYNDELHLIDKNGEAHYIYKEETIMSNAVKNATFTTMVEGVLTDLMLKTTAAQVEVSDGVTLATKIQDLITAINGKSADGHIHATADVTGLDDKLATLATTEAMNTAISAAIDELIDGAPDTYDTLKEIATYISEHKEVVTALNAAIGNKADTSVVTALSEKVTALEGSNHTHDNKAVLDSIIGADYSVTQGSPNGSGVELENGHTYIDDALKAYMDSDTLDECGWTTGMPTLKVSGNAITGLHGFTEYLANLSTLKALAAGIDKKKANAADLGTLASKSAVSAAELDETLTAEVAKIHKHSNMNALASVGESVLGPDYASNIKNEKVIGVLNGLILPKVAITTENGSSGTEVAPTMKLLDAYARLVDKETSDISDKVTALETASGSAQKTYVSATQPEGLKNGDLWINIAE